MAQHLYEILQERSLRFPDAVALGGQQGVGWRTFTSRQLLDAVDQLATELTEEGVQPGDRVILLTPNHPRTPTYLFALWKLGAIPVPFDREMNSAAGARIVASAAPRCIITGYGERPGWAPDRAVREWWEPGSRARSVRASPWQKPREDLAAIFYTSGTTGAPKGCMITHGNLCSQVEALRFTIALDTSSRLASVLPLSHLFELTVRFMLQSLGGSR